MLLAEVNGKPAESSTPATFDGSAVRLSCELRRNRTSESRTQKIASEMRLRTMRLGVLQRRHFAVPGGSRRQSRPLRVLLAAGQQAAPRAVAGVLGWGLVLGGHGKHPIFAG